MTQEMQFGEVEQGEPQRGLPPDQNGHFAVVPVGTPQEDELRIYVELDTFSEMEQHARSDTHVELGGVLLGGHYRDSDGRAYVVISDSLRAQHYHATRGSFKFTHETWQQITRDRAGFPPELQMVGWYHTHPDWGVFLSGMDLFICDHFFNNPMDVALVIDPCRDDRGFFQWTGCPEERIRRTSGFFLIASRFRQAELERYAAWLEGETSMAHSPYSGGAAGGPPVVHVHGQTPAWHLPAVLGLLSLQFCMLLWVAMRPSALAQPQVPLAANAAASETVQPSEIAAQLAVLDEVVQHMDGGAQGLVSRLTERTQQVAELESHLRAHRSRSAELETQVAQLQASLNSTEERAARLQQGLDRLRHQLAQGKGVDRQEREGEPASRGNWWLAAGGLLAGLACGGGAAAGLLARRNATAAAADAPELVEDPAVNADGDR